LAVLVVLTVINFLNYLDRYVLSAVLEPLQRDLNLDDLEAGWLGTVFMVVYMVAAPLCGHLGDRWRRHRMVAVAVLLWSLATIGSGLAEDYTELLIMRAAIGIGEAGYATVAPAVIADLFRPAERGRRLAIFYLAIPMGSALGYLVGGWVGELWGWRSAFFVAGAPGLVFAVVAWFLPEPERGAMDEAVVTPSPSPVRPAVSQILGNPAWRINATATTLMTFAMGGIAFWMPTFLVRTHGLELGYANTLFGGTTVVAGLLGTLIGGTLGDRAYARHAGGYFVVSGWGLLIGAPFACLMPYLSSTQAIIACVFMAEFLLFLNTGPLNAALVACVPARLRASAVAIHVFFIHAFGDALSPSLMGALGKWHDLALAISVTGIPVGLGGIVLLWGATRMRGRPGGLLGIAPR
jgi:MFS family permease